MCVTGCSPSEEEMRELIYLEVKEAIDKKNLTSASESSSNSAPSDPSSDRRSAGHSQDVTVPHGIQERVLASQLYFERLTRIMKDYEPGLPQVVDNTDLLRCLTSETIGNDADMRRLDKSLVKQREQSKKERKKIERNFYERVYMVNFRVDHDWRTRPGFVKKKRYSCWDRDDQRYYNRITRSECTASYHRWRLRSSKWVETASVNLYSGAERPSKPELMQRMDAEKIPTPDRHYCTIRSVERKMKTQYGCKEYGRWQREIRHRRECDELGGDWRLRAKVPTDSVVIVCASHRRTDDPSFVVHAAIPEITSLRIGDVISIPQGRAREVDPALIYGAFESYGGGQPTLKHWVLNVNQGAIRIELVNKNCPTEKELGRALCDLADRKSDPNKIVENCEKAGNVERLRKFAQKWETQRKMRRNTSLMTSTYQALTRLDPLDHPSKLRLAFYLDQTGEPAPVRHVLKALLNQSPGAATLQEIAELAESAALEDIRLEALRGSCNLGDNDACTVVEDARPSSPPTVTPRHP